MPDPAYWPASTPSWTMQSRPYCVMHKNSAAVVEPILYLNEYASANGIARILNADEECNERAPGHLQ